MGKRFGLCALLILMLVVLTACGAESQYNKALELMSKGEYAKAAKKLESISDYEDAKDMAVYCNACAIAEKGDYSTAISMLDSIWYFQDSSIRSTYYEGRLNEKYASSGSMEYMLKALNCYSSTPSFLDSAERASSMENRIEAVKKEQYDAAVKAGENGKYVVAEEAFLALNGYSDSANRIEYYRIRENEANLATDASQDMFMNVSQQYAEMGEYLDCLDRAISLQDRADAVVQAKCTKIDELISAGQYDAAASKLAEFGIYGSDKVKEKYYTLAETYMASGQWKAASAAFKKACPYKDSLKRAYEIEYKYLYNGRVAAGGYHAIGLNADGTVVTAGRNVRGECDVSGWTDIISVSAGYAHTVGLKADGTVVATGDNSYGQCDVSDWTEIVAVVAGDEHQAFTMGLKADGTVVTAGQNNRGRFDVSDWTDIVVIGAGDEHAVGLKADGTVVAVGRDYNKECRVSEWTDIVDIAVGAGQTIGLKANGTVVYTGSGNYGAYMAKELTGVIDIVSGGNEYYPGVVALKQDGTVEAMGWDDEEINEEGWKDIVYVSRHDDFTVALKSDGTVVAVGYGNNYYRNGSVSDWNLFAGSKQGFLATVAQTEQSIISKFDSNLRGTATSKPAAATTPQAVVSTLPQITLAPAACTHNGTREVIRRASYVEISSDAMYHKVETVHEEFCMMCREPLTAEVETSYESHFLDGNMCVKCGYAKSVVKQIVPHNYKTQYAKGSTSYFKNYANTTPYLDDMMDDNSRTRFMWVSCQSEYQDQVPDFTFYFDGEEITHIKIRNGDLSSESNYYGHGRLKELKLVIYYDGKSAIEYVDIPDVYSTDFYEHELPRRYANVTRIEVTYSQEGRIQGTKKGEVNFFYITDIMFMGY